MLPGAAVSAAAVVSAACAVVAAAVVAAAVVASVVTPALQLMPTKPIVSAKTAARIIIITFSIR